jgi:hypothetical protein
MMMLYLSGILRSEAGTPEAKEISRRFNIISERLRKRNEIKNARQEKSRNLPFVFLDRVLPSGFLQFIGSSRCATLNDYATLVLGFARISEKSRLQMGDIAIKLLQLIRERIRLGLIARFVIKYRRRRGRSIGGTGRERETRRNNRLSV